MKTLHISLHELSGGAGIAAYRLFRALGPSGSDTRMLVVNRQSDDSSVISWQSPKRKGKLATWWLDRRLARRHLWLFEGRMPDTYFSGPTSEYDLEPVWEHFLWADVVNLHWCAGLLDWERMLPRIAGVRPIVWTLHDLSPIRGVWHYDPYEFEMTQRLQEWNKQVIRKKTRCLSGIPKSRLRFVAPSRWMADRVRESPVSAGFAVDVIPYSLDLDEFSPLEKETAKAALGLPDNRPVIAFLADGVSDPRKGIQTLVTALANSDFPEEIQVICAGYGRLPSSIRGKVMHLGNLGSPELLRLFYSASDVFLCLSLQDNLPNTVLEAMACGTAVVGSNVGGIPDMVVDGGNGWLVKPGDPEDLVACIKQLVKDLDRVGAAGKRGRERAELLYAPTIQAAAYERVYREMLRETAALAGTAES